MSLRVLISECLLGAPVRYDGGAKPSLAVERLARCLRRRGGEGAVVPVCPEVLGGLACPRPPAERRGSRVVTADGVDVTRAYADGARRSLDIARACGASLAILKSKSPSCGLDRIYDGTFSGQLRAGSGVTAALFEQEGHIVVADEKLVEYCEPSMEHPIALVLGSGLAPLADEVRVVRRIKYEDIDGFPTEAIPVEGHRYEVIIGTLEGVPVVVYPGRVHLYQGYSPLQVTSLVRHAHRLGCRDIILTCASGAVSAVASGMVGLITDHINLTGQNPLATPQGVAAAEADTPFIPMAGAYSGYLAEFARAAARDAGLHLAEGVYAGLLGPTYETAAEVRMLNTLGADYVGCSTVCEAIMAKALGMEVLGITLVTNKAGMIDNSHEDALKAAEKAATATQSVLKGTISYLGGH